MKLPLLILSFIVSSITSCSAQTPSPKHPELILLQRGDRRWPITLSKEWFEGDTVYTITFRDARFKSHTGCKKGFFKHEFKYFGKALKAPLLADPESTVEFEQGVIKITRSQSGRKQIECKFSTGAWIFRVTEPHLTSIIHSIETE